MWHHWSWLILLGSCAPRTHRCYLRDVWAGSGISSTGLKGWLPTIYREAKIRRGLSGCWESERAPTFITLSHLKFGSQGHQRGRWWSVPSATCLSPRPALQASRWSLWVSIGPLLLGLWGQPLDLGCALFCFLFTGAQVLIFTLEARAPPQAPHRPGVGWELWHLLEVWWEQVPQKQTIFILVHNCLDSWAMESEGSVSKFVALKKDSM